MLEIAYTMHRGRQNPEQQDSLLIGEAIYQTPAFRPLQHAGTCANG